MALTLTFNQFGLPAGQTDRGRTDLVSDVGPDATHAYPIEITVGGTPAGTTLEVVMLDEIPGAAPLLTQVSDTEWTLQFALGSWGPFRIRANAVQGGQVIETVTRRVSVRSPGYGLHYPALAERYDPNATWVASVPSVQITEMNEGSSNRPLVDFHRTMVETLETIATGGVGSIPDGSITEAKLDPAFVAEIVLTDGSHAMVADLDLDSHRIVNVGAPVDDNDAARLADVLASQYVAGDGLVLTGDTLHVGPNADGSIVVDAEAVGVGVLATDAQHGSRGGGTTHSNATAASSGFQSAADKAKLDTIAPNADNTVTALAAATAAVSVNGQRITGLGSPTGTQDAATKQYVDSRAPNAHGVTHEAGGDDEISVDGLTGTLIDPQLAGSLKTATGTVEIAAAGAPSVGQVLTATTGGAAAVGAWQTPTQLASLAPSQVTVTTAAAGSGTTAARSDHVHSVATAAPAALGAGNSAAVGSSTSLARADHVHGVPVAAPSALTVGGSNTGGSSTSLARADHVHALPAFSTTATAGAFTQANDPRLSDDRIASGLRTATGIVDTDGAAAPTVGQVLTATTGGAAAVGEWQTPLQLASAAPSQVSVTTAAAGVGSTAARADHVHSVATAAPSAETIGAAQAAGTSASLARADHVHAMPALVTTSVDGFISAADKVKLDGIAASAAALTSATPMAVSLTAPAVGVATTAARADHVHDAATAAPSALTVGGSTATGTSASLARADHVHAMPTLATTSVAGFQSAADKTKLDGISASAAALTSAAPMAVSLTASAVGVATTAARADHVHDAATAAPSGLTVGGSTATGTSSSLARADHVHSMPAVATTSVSGFLSAADKTKLDGIETGAQVTSFARVQTALAAASGSVSINSQKLTSVLDPTSAQDAATKAYVDAVANAVRVKQAVRVATTTAGGNITLAGGAPNVLDGITLALNDRILVKNNSSWQTHGLYTVTTLGTGANGTWTRAVDADVNAELASGMTVFVYEGTVNAGTMWTLNNPDPITIGSTAIVFALVAGATHVNAAGNGLTKTATSGGSGSKEGASIAVTAHADGSIAVSASGVQVGALATDAQHGTRAGGTLHAVATTSVAGFQSAADKTKLDGIATSAAALTSSAAATVGTTNAVGVGTTAARSDHVHAHGAQTDGTLHAVATTSVAGFQSAADKTKLDGIAASAAALASTAPTANGLAAVGVGTTAARSDHTHPSTWKEACRVFLTTDNLTHSGGAPSVVDGVTVSVGDRVLASVASGPSASGIYQVQTVGTGSNGTWVYVEALGQGEIVETYAGSGYAQVLWTWDGSAYARIYPEATPSAAGLMSAFDKSKLNGIAASAAAVSSSAPTQITVTTAAAGSGTSAARSDHVHSVATAAPSAETVGAAQNAGSSTSLARADHVHAMPGVATTSVDGFQSAADKTKLDGIAASAAALTSTAPADLRPNLSAAVGVGTTAARHDHVHAVASAAPIQQQIVASNLVGTATTFARSDHVHTFLTAAPTNLLVGAATTEGTSLSFPRADHVHGMPGLAASGADGFMSSDDKYLLSVMPKVNQCRLSGESSNAVMSADNATVGTIYLLPYTGDIIWLYWSAQTRWYPFSVLGGVSLALSGLTAGRPYDVFCVAPATRGGTPTLELLAWASTTARATGLSTILGIPTKSGDQSRRYVGTIYARATNSLAFVRAGYTTTTAKCDIWNQDNRVKDRWEFNTAWAGSITVGAANTWFQADTGAKLEFIAGQTLMSVASLHSIAVCSNGTGNYGQAGISLNSTTANPGTQVTNLASHVGLSMHARKDSPTLGYNYLQWMLRANNTAVAFFTTNGSGSTTYANNAYADWEY